MTGAGPGDRDGGATIGDEPRAYTAPDVGETADGIAAADTGAVVDAAAERLGPGARSALLALLEDDPNGIEFFHAVRMLERLAPERAPVGGFADPAEEVVRFTVPPSIAFPASEIQSLRRLADEPARMAVNFLGLTGPLGVLPYAYTLAVSARARARDTALRDFLDLFHHRLVSLFYRAWRKYRFTVTQGDAPFDPLGAHVADLIGLGTPGLRGRTTLRDQTLLFYAGLLAPHRRSAVGLEQLVSDYFGVPATVEQFVGDWYPLAVRDRCALDDDRTSPASCLGLGAVVGDEVWDPQARVRVRLGPLRRAQYDDFLPGGAALQRLRDLVRLYTDDQLDVEVQLVLRHDDVPGCELGGGVLPLGWATWLRTAPAARDADDAVFTL